MECQDHTLTFVGEHPETGTPMCGVLTDDFDALDAPFSFSFDAEGIDVDGGGRIIRFSAPGSVIAMLSRGVDLYVANVGGSETVHLATRRSFMLQ